MKIYKYIILSALSISSVACSLGDRYEEMNKDENYPTRVLPNVILTNIERQVFSSVGGFQANNSSGDSFIGLFSQHFSGNHAQGLNYEAYELSNGDFQNFFENSYTNDLKDSEQIIKTSPAEYKKYVGVAKILMAYKLGYLTSLYGDIPYSEAFNPNIIKPKYDSQESLYNSIQNLLSEAIIDIDNGAVELKGDFIYEGNDTKWKAAAYLLSARFYNHLSKKDPIGSATKALKAVDMAKSLGMNSSDWDLLAKFEGSSLFLNSYVPMYSNGMVVANKPFLDNLISSNDPRTEAFFSSIDYKENNVYGIGKIQSSKPGTGIYSSVGGNDSFYGQSNSSIPAATYCELLMIEAEAAFRKGDLPRSALAHNKAVSTHINQVAKLPSAIAKIPQYIATYGSETSSSISLQKIMTEKHKIMFTMTVESWMDFRRHGNMYPIWASIPLNETESAPVSNKYIERILYPQSELNLNGSNVPSVNIYTKLPILN